MTTFCTYGRVLTVVQAFALFKEQSTVPEHTHSTDEARKCGTRTVRSVVCDETEPYPSSPLFSNSTMYSYSSCSGKRPPSSLFRKRKKNEEGFAFLETWRIPIFDDSLMCMYSYCRLCVFRVRTSTVTESPNMASNKHHFPPI